MKNWITFSSALWLTSIVILISISAIYVDEVALVRVTLPAATVIGYLLLTALVVAGVFLWIAIAGAIPARKSKDLGVVVFKFFLLPAIIPISFFFIIFGAVSFLSIFYP